MSDTPVETVGEEEDDDNVGEDPGNHLPEPVNLPVEIEHLPVNEEILTNPPDGNLLDVEVPLETGDPETVQSESSATAPDDTTGGDIVPKRSSCQRQPPQRLQCSVLGNPLISVIQTLFHSLSNVYTEALSRVAADPLSKL